MTISTDIREKNESLQNQVKEIEKKAELSAQKEGTYKQQLKYFQKELSDCNIYYYDLWLGRWQLNADIEQSKEDLRMYKTKYNTSQKQLFASKREIDELQERINTTTKELEEEKMRAKLMQIELEALKNNAEATGNTNPITTSSNNMFLQRLIRKNTVLEGAKEFELLELHQEITELNTKLASKDIELETLRQENEKWQNAHDSIWTAFNESQQELGKVKNEMEDAQVFYKKKLTKLRDIIQDNEIELFQFEKRVEELEELYFEKTKTKAPKWKKSVRGDRNVPRLSAMFMDASKSAKRISTMRDSLLSNRSSITEAQKPQIAVQISFRSDPKVETAQNSVRNLADCDETIDILNPFGASNDTNPEKKEDEEEELREDKDEFNVNSPFSIVDSDSETERDKSRTRIGPVLSESRTSRAKDSTPDPPDEQSPF